MLARYIERSDTAYPDVEASLEAGKLKRTKLLHGCLNSLRAMDAAAVSKSTAEFLKYYLKSEFDSSGIATLFSIEGTIVWHVAQRAGLEITGLSDKARAMIITRETLGIDA